jgi:hypothetical protein
MAALSPVRLASSVEKSIVWTRRASAATESPASSSSDLRGGQDDDLPPATQARVRGRELLQGVERSLRAPLLVEAEDRVEDHDEEDRDRVPEAREQALVLPRG